MQLIAWTLRMIAAEASLDESIATSISVEAAIPIAMRLALLFTIPPNSFRRRSRVDRAGFAVADDRLSWFNRRHEL